LPSQLAALMNGPGLDVPLVLPLVNGLDQLVEVVIGHAFVKQGVSEDIFHRPIMASAAELLWGSGHDSGCRGSGSRNIVHARYQVTVCERHAGPFECHQAGIYMLSYQSTQLHDLLCCSSALLCMYFVLQCSQCIQPVQPLQLPMIGVCLAGWYPNA